MVINNKRSHLLVIDPTWSKDNSTTRRRAYLHRKKPDKTIAMRSPRWIGNNQSTSDDEALALPPALKNKVHNNMYLANATLSGSTLDDDVSFATVRTFELGVPPYWERIRKHEQQQQEQQQVEFVDHELGEDAAVLKKNPSRMSSKSLKNPETIPEEAEDKDQDQDGASPPKSEIIPLQREVAGIDKAGVEEGQPSGQDINDIDNAGQAVVQAIEQQVAEVLQNSVSPLGNHSAVGFFENNLSAEPVGGAPKPEENAMVPEPVAAAAGAVGVDEIDFHGTHDDAVLHGLAAIDSDGDTFVPPPQEIVIDTNSQIVRSSLKDYHTEIDALDQLIEKYAGSTPKSQQQRQLVVGTNQELEVAADAVVSVEEPAPVVANDHEATSPDPIDTAPQETTGCSLASGLDYLTNSAEAAVRVMFAPCTPVGFANEFAFDDLVETKDPIDTLSVKPDYSPVHSIPELRRPSRSNRSNRSNRSVVNIGEPTFIPVQPATPKIVAAAETRMVKEKDKKGKLASIRKAFVSVFSREQKKQRSQQRKNQPDSASAEAGTKAPKRFSEKKPKTGTRVELKDRKALAVKKKRWPFRGSTASHTGVDNRSSGAPYEVRLGKPQSIPTYEI
jgi:hypothetical protein